jgi:peroxiredoxin
MNPKLVLSLGLFALLASSALAGSLEIGSEVPDFTLENLGGEDVAYSSLSGDVTVVLFVSTQCPISNDYNERMKSLYADYKDKGVKFVFVNANRTEPAGQVARHAAEKGFEFPVYKDPGNVVADLFGAQFTPETYVVTSGKIAYHGRIDDARTGEIKQHSLRMALDAVMEGNNPDPAKTRAFGCTIKKVS